MKVISYSECRACGAQFISGNKVVLEQGDEIEIVCRKIQRCSQCKLNDDRSPLNKKNKFADNEW